MRFALPNARIMVHQPSGGFQGQATDIMLHAQEILNLKKRLNEIYVKHTGQPLKKIEDALERDYFLTAEMARGVRPDRQGDRQAARRSRRRQGRLISGRAGVAIRLTAIQSAVRRGGQKSVAMLGVNRSSLMKFLIIAAASRASLWSRWSVQGS